MTKIAIGYARVSTDEQAKGYSLSTQLDAIRAYAQQRGYELTEVFQDDYTGASLDRPELDRLRDYIVANRVDVVVVHAIDRLARKAIYRLLIEEELSKRGTRTEYVIGQYEDTDEGKLQKGIMSDIAEYEKAKILERFKRGKRGKARAGFAVVAARPPYGYQIKSEPHKSWLLVDDDEAVTVRLVYQWFIFGEPELTPVKRHPLSLRAIATKLSANHVVTRGDGQAHVAKKNGHGVWAAAMIRHILSNETYTGTWHYGKTKMMGEAELSSLGDNKRLKTLRDPERKERIKKTTKGKTSLDSIQAPAPRENWQAVAVPAIIDGQIFEMAQQRLALNREQATRNVKREYLMGRRIRCAKCGHSMVGRTRREKNQYYYCNGREKLGGQCDVMPVRCDVVDSTVWAWVKATMQNPEHLAAGLRGERAQGERVNLAIQDRLQLVNNTLAETSSQLAKLLDVYLAGGFPKELLAERRGALERRRADLEQDRQQLLGHLSQVIWTEDKIQEVEAAVLEISDGLDAATFQDKLRYLDLLDVRSQYALEGDSRVVYVKCRLGSQRLSVVPTLPLQSEHNRSVSVTLTARLVLRELQTIDLAISLFTEVTHQPSEHPPIELPS